MGPNVLEAGAASWNFFFKKAVFSSDSTVDSHFYTSLVELSQLKPDSHFRI